MSSLSYVSYGIFGVWPSGYDVFNFDVETYAFEGILVGTHIANDQMFLYNEVLETYMPPGSGFQAFWQDWSYDWPLTNINLFVIESSINTYGLNYTAEYYKETYSNIRAIYWV